MYNFRIIIIIVSLTVGYLECILSKRYKNHNNTYISSPFEIKIPSLHWLASLVYLCARLFEAPNVFVCVIRHPLEYTFVYATFTDDSESGCPKTSLTLRGKESDPTKHTSSWKEKEN